MFPLHNHHQATFVYGPEIYEKLIHLGFRPSNTDIFSLMQTCPDVKAIQVPPSYIKTISDSTMMLLDMKGIALLEGDLWELYQFVCYQQLCSVESG